MKPYALFPRTPGLFSSLNVQKNMLQDEERTKKFREVIFKTVKEGEVVIDLGTGTGILSIWAAQAGAKHVYAIEETDVAEIAESVIKANGLEKVITVLRANSSEVVLPEMADILVAELVGHFLFEEGIIESVAGVRESWLKPNAKIIPATARVFIAPAELGSAFTEVSYWNAWKEPDLSLIRRRAANSAYVETVREQDLLAAPVELFNIDFSTATPQCLQARAVFHCEQDGELDALAGWFNLFLGEEVYLGTGPCDAPTHWQQCVFPLEQPCHVAQGDIVECAMLIEPFAPGCAWHWEVIVKASGFREKHEATIIYGVDSRLLKERFQ